MAGPGLADPVVAAASGRLARETIVDRYINKLDSTYLTAIAGQVLTYDSGTGTYKPQTPGGNAVAINVKDYGALGNNGVANDTTAIDNALAAANADPLKPTVIFPPGVYRRTAPMTPYTGMRLVALGRGSEFSHGAKITNSTTDMFTPTADVSDMHIEGIQFEGNTATKATDWWAVGTGFQILYSHIDKCGFTGWKRVYSGNWTGVTFENFYANGNGGSTPYFNLGGSDAIFGPGYMGSGGFNATTLTASVTSGAGPKTITVANATGAAIGNPVYISDASNGNGTNRDIGIISAVAGNNITIGTLTNSHASGEFVQIVLQTPAVEIKLSHSLIERLYISSGAGMPMHVTGGHSSTFINCELSGAPAHSAGPGLYVVAGQGHQFVNTVASAVCEKMFAQFQGGIVIYDSTDLTFQGTIFDNISSASPNLWRIGRSGGGGGTLLTDRIKIAGTSKYSISGTAVPFSQAGLAGTGIVIDYDEFPVSKAGAPTDADFYNVPRDGFTITDTTNNLLYVRSGGIWRPIALTSFPAYKAASYYFCNAPASTSTSNTLGNGSLRLSPWVVTQALTITRIGCEFTAAGDAASLFRIGIYADDGTGVPTGSPILDAGSISTGTGNAGTVATGGTPGSYEITLGSSLTLQPGVYWVGGAVQGVTVTQPTMRTSGGGSMIISLPSATIPGINAGNYAYGLNGVTGALGAWSGASAASAAVRIFVKTA
jgi:hypothetical protein